MYVCVCVCVCVSASLVPRPSASRARIAYVTFEPLSVSYSWQKAHRPAWANFFFGRTFDLVSGAMADPPTTHAQISATHPHKHMVGQSIHTRVS